MALNLVGRHGYKVKWYKGTTEPSDWETVSASGSETITDINQTYHSIVSGLEYGAKYYWAVALYDIYK
ncbi:MAG: hypothetical protein U5K00_00585 [Melioribacteraceae bacterium]|nr:hypothetical protein [Melioribacteraceae bacterium]